MPYHRIMLRNLFKCFQPNPTKALLAALLIGLSSMSSVSHLVAQVECECGNCDAITCGCEDFCVSSCPEGIGPCIPLDGGLSLLVMGGLAYGARATRRRREDEAGAEA
jgi:hypothetical protein